MLVFINGKFVPEKRAVVSVFDRSFLYGDGLFDALLVRNGKPFRWEQHFKRLQRGAEFLRIKLPFTSKALRQSADILVKKNKMADAMLRITVSRGVGVRGYSPRGADQPIVVMSLYPAPTIDLRNPLRWKLASTSFRVPATGMFAKHKTNNRLAQVCARMEADAACADEALLVDTDEHVIEGATSNLFWIKRGVVYTPPLTAGILPGITRALVADVCRKLGQKLRERHITLPKLKRADGVFISVSSRGVVEAVSLDGQKLKSSPLIDKIRRACWKIVCAETA